MSIVVARDMVVDMTRYEEQVAIAFLRSVENMFKSDANWSVADLDGYLELAELANHRPDPDAMEVEEVEILDENSS